tara:strand:+ start:126 stop:1112 length:987 start_codon:yes stop_codon:yes gene_type:complete
MIISKTPFRISFFGGGTDYPVWIKEHGGAVLGTTIDKYAYITCRYLPSFFDHKYRIIYSQIENVKSIDDIDHPSVRECIRFSNIQPGLEIHHDSDLPARSGLGSSSSFTVGLLNCLNALKEEYSSKKNLSKDAIHVEQDLIGESVGCQDQIHAAYGGFNYIDFYQDGRFKVNPVIINSEVAYVLQAHCLLFFTGFSRIASEIASEQIKNIPKKKKELNLMQDMVVDAIKILNGTNVSIEDFGKLLHESWELKRSLTNKITSDAINSIYETATKAGANGGKLLGAGGGGFILFIAKPELHESIKQKLKDLVYVPFKFEKTGSSIIFCNP